MPNPLFLLVFIVLATSRPACALEQSQQPSQQPSQQQELLSLDNTYATPVPPRAPFIHNRDSIPDRPPVILLWETRQEYSLKTKLDTSDGSVEITRSGSSANIVFGPEYDLQVSIPIDYETSHYRFRGMMGLTPDGRYPLLDAEQLFLAPNVEVAINEYYGAFVGGIVSLAGQYDISSTDSASYGGFAGVRYKPDPSLTLRAGLAGFTQIEDDVLILPAIQFDWKLDERTRLSAEGSELRLEHDLDESWTIKLAAAWEMRSFRLDDNAPIPHGVFRDQRIPITFRLEYVPHAALRFETWAGLQAYQHYQLDDPNGVKYRDERAEPTAIIGLSVLVIF